MTLKQLVQRAMFAVGVPALRADERVTTGVTFYPFEVAPGTILSRGAASRRRTE